MRNVQINSNFLYLCGRKMKRMTNYLEELNESQRNAVLYNDGPSLVLPVLVGKLVTLLLNLTQDLSVLAETRGVWKL